MSSSDNAPNIPLPPQEKKNEARMPNAETGGFTPETTSVVVGG